eukprot:14455173-Alexandrium_andersonii.AAC.1
MTPSVATLRAGGAARSAAPLARGAKTSGSPFSAELKPWTGTFRLFGACWDRSLVRMECRPPL